MIAKAVPRARQSRPNESSPCWQREFLRMLPSIKRHARIVFRNLHGEAREEAVQEVVCNACQAFAQLAEQGRTDAATWSSLAKYAVAHYRAGRRLASPLNIGDVCSAYCQHRKGVTVQSLCGWDSQNEEWTEILVEDKTCTPAELAASRIDFPAFLGTLSRRDRRIAETLATGESTSVVARRFKVSPARVSQLRQELRAAWEEFHEGPHDLSITAA